MPSFEILTAFFVATVVFAYMPGPAMLYTAAQTIARGRRAGLMAAFGIHVGGYVHVTAAALGLSALFHAVPTLYAILKFAGAAYLVWLGFQLFRRSGENEAATLAIPEKSAQRAFAESIVVEILNPKAAIFFVAFLPQFVDAAAVLPIWAQFLILGTIVNMTFSSADVVCVGMAGSVIERLRRSSRAKRLTQRLGGSLLIGLGAHLALQK